MTIEKRDDRLPGGGRLPTQEEFRHFTDKGGPLCAKWCAKCDCHYEYCECEMPEWRIRNEGELGPMPGAPGGPRTLLQAFKKWNRDADA